MTKENKIKLTILFTVAIDVVGFGVVIPILPFYVRSFGATPFVVTALFACFSIFAFFSSPLLGSLSDKIGRRPVLLISMFSTAVGWFVFAFANSLWLLFLGRIIDGLAAGNFSTAQGYMVDIAKDNKERTSNLGLLGAVFGIAFIVGPVLGGFLGTFSHRLPFLFVGILAALNIIAAYFFLPETNFKRKSGSLDFNPFSPLLRALKNKKMMPLYLMWLLFAIAIALTNSIVAMYVSDVYQFTPLMVSAIMVGQGVFMAINQSVGLKHFWLKKFKEPDLQFYILILFVASYFIMAIPVLWVFLFGTAVMSVVHSVFRVITNSLAVGGAAPDEKGEVLGIMSSVMSLGMIIGPILGGVIYGVNKQVVFVASALLMTLALTVEIIGRRRLSKIKPEEDPRTDTILG